MSSNHNLQPVQTLKWDASLEDIPGFNMHKKPMIRIKPRKHDSIWNSHVLVWRVVEAKKWTASESHTRSLG